MGLTTLASGTLKKGAQTLYVAPTGRWATISSIQIVNKAGADSALDLTVRSASDEVHLAPDGFVLLNHYKIEHDQPLGLAPGGYVKANSALAGLTFIVTGEERTSQ
jgi:hypothetical protein